MTCEARYSKWYKHVVPCMINYSFKCRACWHTAACRPQDEQLLIHVSLPTTRFAMAISDDSVLLLQPSLHDLAISLSAQPAATMSKQEEQVYISSTMQVILLLVASKCICVKVLELQYAQPCKPVMLSLLVHHCKRCHFFAQAVQHC